MLPTLRTLSHTDLDLHPSPLTQVVVWDISQREAELKEKNALSHKVHGFEHWSPSLSCSSSFAFHRHELLHLSIYLSCASCVVARTLQGVVDDNSQKTQQLPPVRKQILSHYPTPPNCTRHHYYTHRISNITCHSTSPAYTLNMYSLPFDHPSTTHPGETQRVERHRSFASARGVGPLLVAW